MSKGRGLLRIECRLSCRKPTCGSTRSASFEILNRITYFVLHVNLYNLAGDVREFVSGGDEGTPWVRVGNPRPRSTPMTAAAMIRRVRQAVKEVRAMGGQGFTSMEECWGAGRKAAAEVLHQQMLANILAHLEQCAVEGIEDRLNGYYPRQIMTMMGNIELRVPRTRRYTPAGVLRAYARRAP